MTGTPRAYRDEPANPQEMIHTRLTERIDSTDANNKTGGGRAQRAMS